MAAVRNFLSRLWSDEGGQTMTEYGLILALIALVVVVAIVALGPQIAALFDKITGCLSNANAGNATSTNCP